MGPVGGIKRASVVLAGSGTVRPSPGLLERGRHGNLRLRLEDGDEAVVVGELSLSGGAERAPGPTAAAALGVAETRSHPLRALRRFGMCDPG